MPVPVLQGLLTIGSGALVGLTLGLVGGGGSILAVPLLAYVVGVADPHVAIGTSALGVAANAANCLVAHARAGTVRWRCGIVFSGIGMLGALAGSSLGQAVDGRRLLALFALVMIAVGILMWRQRRAEREAGTDCTLASLPKLALYAAATGLGSGFFGIGGGFLIVPALTASTGMAMLNAVGTSLVAVTSFGLATALNYARAGLVDWRLAGLFILGGAVGSLLGTRAGRALAPRRGALAAVFAVGVVAVALVMLWLTLGPR